MKEERWNRFMQLQQQISAERLQEKIGREIMVLIDEVDEEGAIGRSMADAPGNRRRGVPERRKRRSTGRRAAG
ncbi:Ribosomal protein S12 methylthiotransferase RimO [Raoultella terrigena]|uniref:Ribosomal protein S12 methylthiotransferase RimO n=1 Tax=Raoultella terrigena TaxID=577 RepID=A0A4U9DAU4_RAOTE|nr:Ribosomal protein S12 methylthiotransferase RimO [Raoultella terrigena]